MSSHSSGSGSGHGSGGGAGRPPAKVRHLQEIEQLSAALKPRAVLVNPRPEAVAKGAVTVTVLFVRHGEGEHNARIKALQDQGASAEEVEAMHKREEMLDARLTAEGLQQALHCREKVASFQPELVYCSPMTRALQTCEAAIEAGRSVTVLETLREQMGVHMCDQRRSVTELKREFPAYDFSSITTDADTLWSATERESKAAMVQRSALFLRRLATGRAKRVAVFSHSALLLTLCYTQLSCEEKPDLLSWFDVGEAREMTLCFPADFASKESASHAPVGSKAAAPPSKLASSAMPSGSRGSTTTNTAPSTSTSVSLTIPPMSLGAGGGSGTPSGRAPAVESSNRRLWRLVSAELQLQDTAGELAHARVRLQKGVMFYNPPSAESRAALEKEMGIGPATAAHQRMLFDYMLELSRRLLLSETQTHQIFNSFFLDVHLETRTNDLPAYLQKTLTDKELRLALTDRIIDYYHEERLHILRCQKHILAFYNNEDEVYDQWREMYRQCVVDMSTGGCTREETEQIVNSVRQSRIMEYTQAANNNPRLSELEACSRTLAGNRFVQTTNVRPALTDFYAELKLPASPAQRGAGQSALGASSSPATPASRDQPSNANKDLTPKQVASWIVQILKERRERLQIMLLYTMNFDCTDADKNSIYESLTQPLLPESLLFVDRIKELCNYDIRPLMAQLRYLQLLLAIDTMRLGELAYWIAAGEHDHIQQYVRHDMAAAIRSQHMSAWLKNPAPQHGPLLLAWTAICELLQDPAYMGFAQQALDAANTEQADSPEGVPGKPFDALLQCVEAMQMGHRLQEFGERLTAEGVLFELSAELVAGLLNIVLPAFMWQIAGRSSSEDADTSIYDKLVALVTMLFARDYRLRRSFWDSLGTNHENGLHMIVAHARLRFPTRYVSFLQLVSSLASGRSHSLGTSDIYCAQKTFEHLKTFHSYTDKRSLSEFNKAWTVESGMHAFETRSWEGSECPTVRARCDLHAYDESGWDSFMATQSGPMRLEREPLLLIPAGTQGILLECLPGDVVLVKWAFSYSAWAYFVRSLDQVIAFVSGSAGTRILEDADRASALEAHACFLELVGHLYDDVDLAKQLEQHIEATVEARSSTVRPKLSTPMLSRVFLMLQKSAEFVPTPLRLLSACMECIGHAAKTFPGLVWGQMSQFAMITPSQGFLRRVLYNTERRDGRYPVTLLFLDCLLTLLRHVLSPGPVSDSALYAPWDGLLLYVRHVLHDIFAEHEAWKYVRMQDKHEISQRVLRIVWFVLQQTESPSADLSASQKRLCKALRSELLNDLQHDAAVAKALLSIISAGASSIDALFAMRQDSAAKARVELVELAFNVLNAVMVSKSAADKDSSQLEVLLLEVRGGTSQGLGLAAQGTVSQTNVIVDIATFARHTRTLNLPVYATRLLTQICRCSSHLGERSILASLGTHADTLQRIFINRLVDKSPTAASGHLWLYPRSRADTGWPHQAAAGRQSAHGAGQAPHARGGQLRA
eukprot:m.209698 g.209698  ORF g.209698 m.209698 type:complete len:1495 (+) comp17810_c0_seq4:74-4558(+)